MSPQSLAGIGEAPVAALDALRFPLHGSRLIEASAGTGKTYTIAALYVRLVLGHGRSEDGGSAYARALNPPEILVVTFTEAATQELRERIRRRLAEAAACFLSDPEDEGGDELLRELRADYPRAAWGGCARRLQVAAEWMDEAAVSTIHGWCNRMLREHAFDSDSLFTQALEADQSELFGEVVRDYWRTFMAPLDTPSVAEVLPWWPGPDALQGDLRALVDHAELLADAAEPALLLPAARNERLRQLAGLKAPWAAWVDELQELLDSARDNKRFNGVKLKKNNYDNWLAALGAWRDDPESRCPTLTPAARQRLTVAGLAEVWKEAPAPQHPALDAIAALDSQLASLPEARSNLLCHAARWVARRFAQEQARHAQIGFNDLLTRLDAALRGANGTRLAQRMRRQFPVALIDEFQDTDPVQYRIFDAVYGLENNDASTALILIGDPKQAIYAFRGADIHTYLAARRACAGRLYTLKTNFRSTAHMVDASNRCFSAAEQRAAGDGAFLFRGTDGSNPLPFVAADAKGRRTAWQVDGTTPAALTVCCLNPGNPGDDPAVISKEVYRAQMAQVCASQMVSLLNRAPAGRAGFAPGGALRPADMAVLVSNRREAQAIRDALGERGVRSVYLSDKESVFACAQAAELQHWLAACAEPDDARLLRAALATATLGLSYARLDALNHDELAWEARVLQFRDYRECWRRQGVLPMLRRLLNDFDVPARLLGAGADQQGGERILTDLLHLAELMQQASVLLDGEHALIRHLAEQRREAGQGAGGDARQIRLESDADLVQVVTVHKSKGLEYPLVFLPFACSTRQTRADDLPLIYHDEDGAVQLALSASDEVLARVERERLGEDLRKLYVALTRARYATWIGVGALAALERSAFGYLVGGGQPLPPATLLAALDEWRGDCAQIAIVVAPEADRQRLAAAVEPTRLGVARRMTRAVGEHWWVASYSALKTAATARLTAQLAGALAETSVEAAEAAADTASADQFSEDRVVCGAADVSSESAQAIVPALENAAASLPPGALHGLPRGADVGSFLHGLLEAAASGGFARLAGDPQRLRELVDRRCQLRGWERWSETLGAWLGGFLRDPLTLAPGQGVAASSFSLAGLASAQVEMEFWLAAQRVDSQALDRLVCAHTLGGAPRPALQAGQLNGMLKGFIDLVFEHQGRYFVADYKSNWLGPDDSAYTPDALRAAILHARYELQYVLYLFALHRLLKSRLPDYDYDRHVGGAVYIFLRGLSAPGQGLHAERPPRALIEALDHLFIGQGAQATEERT